MCFLDNIQACELLLDHGADPMAKTEVEGWTGLFHPQNLLYSRNFSSFLDLKYVPQN